MTDVRRRRLRAGRVGRPHGLDGSFHVGEPIADLLALGEILEVAGTQRTVTRRAGFDARPILRLEGCEDRGAAQALLGEEIFASRDARTLDADEWWADELEGCTVRDGTIDVGTVTRLLGLPSCEVLEVARADGGPPLLVPLVGDAVHAVDVVARVIEIDLRFLGEP
ncbi:MAG: ribosome maturation factor RimM [Solirubrobacteraceae bacterium]